MTTPGPAAGAAVGVLLAARLACANLDGGVARDGDRATPFGSVLNEVGDRARVAALLADATGRALTTRGGRTKVHAQGEYLG